MALSGSLPQINLGVQGETQGVSTTLYAKSKLYSLAYKAWKRHGPQNLTTWTLLAQAVLDGCCDVLRVFSLTSPLGSLCQN
ncbi:hypothetical protein TNCV_550101 [Trichonephila clavipes]|nr:hypothetical protein TNCV_550101 [Trichonephila clavipes]